MEQADYIESRFDCFRCKMIFYQKLIFKNHMHIKRKMLTHGGYFTKSKKAKS